MRRAMAEAEVGDDVYGDDPTVKVLEDRTAELLGKEAALFVPSGTMANQIAVGVNTQPGDELLCAATSHVYVWEAGGIARLSGVTARTFEGDGGLLVARRPARRHPARPRRSLCPDPAGLSGEHPQSRRRPNPSDREHRGDRALGSRAQPGHASGRSAADERGRGLGSPGTRVGAVLRHGLDLLFQGARGTDRLGPGRLGRRDPPGAALAQTFRRRDAAGWNHRRRGRSTLSNITSIAWARIMPTPGFWPMHSPAPTDSRSNRGPVETNLVWVSVDPSVGTAAEVAAYLRSRGILVSVPGTQVLRACTHLDVTREQVEYAADVIRQIEPAMISAMTLVY